jgi:hypothetical protein
VGQPLRLRTRFPAGPAGRKAGLPAPQLCEPNPLQRLTVHSNTHCRPTFHALPRASKRRRKSSNISSQRSRPGGSMDATQPSAGPG